MSLRKLYFGTLSMSQYQRSTRSPSPGLAEQPAQFADGTRVKTLYDTQCQSSFKKIAKGTLATTSLPSGIREYRIAAIRDGVEYHGVPEDAITDKLNESDALSTPHPTDPSPDLPSSTIAHGEFA
ncbi:hypothetical protein FA13DRAFT_1782726 [Coprinellus micaceus]|uniref:Uncharacterized protein n=1 Tax=Coprinellus micaceus TaxID=71717 RepID=A0A4Y7RY06_COPMI|nr:hypothetical protein FA13DRAFT_1782726 [Coprinellus micaceus]